MNSLKLLREVGGKIRARVLLGAAACTLASLALGQATGPTRITLDEAIQMALQHNHNMLAARTTIQQSEAEETTANLRPNPTLFADWEYLPLGAPAKQNPGLYSGQSTNDYLKNNTEGDIGLSYLIERGRKRQHRLQAAKDITAQTRSLVADNERSLTFNTAALFVNVQLAESTIELAEKDLKSFQQTVDLSELRYSKGAMSEDDYLKIKLQLLQFETDYQAGRTGKGSGTFRSATAAGLRIRFRRLRRGRPVRLPAAEGKSGRLPIKGLAEPG